MIIGRKSCSQTQSVRGRLRTPRLGEAKARAVASRELGSASLHNMGVASLQNVVKPAPVREATTVGTDRTPRGERRQRAPKEPAGTWETRFGVLTRQPPTGSHNRRRGRVAESDGLAAWAAVRRNDGAPGVEGVSIEDIAVTPEGEARHRWWNPRKRANPLRCGATTRARPKAGGSR